MEITFQTKKESNRKQQADFLKLSPINRVYRFIELMQLSKKLPTKHPHNKELKMKENTNFVIEIKTH